MTTYVPFVDISHYQGNVDFGRMASHGVKAVLCKVTEGGAEDPKWRQYAHDARAAGLACGGYHFVNTGSSYGAEGQADRFVTAVHAVGPPLMLHMYDMEWSGVTGPERGSALAAYYVRCVNRADSQLGAKGSIYTIKSFWRDYTGNSPALADHDLIVATARGGTPPTDASLWGPWFDATGGVLPPKYYPVGPWTDWAACQFAVPNGIGPTYGCQSSALDLDVVKPDVFARWTGQVQEDDLPLSTDDLAAIKALLVANNPAIWSQTIPARYGAPAGPAEERLTATRVDAGTAKTYAGNAQNNTDTVEPTLTTLSKTVTDLVATVTDQGQQIQQILDLVSQVGGLDGAQIAQALEGVINRTNVPSVPGTLKAVDG